jgi:uncharacterized protein
MPVVTPGLTPTEARVLGVLIEKAQTTPGQYPITLNGLVNGCNQLSNRHPVTNLDEDTVLAALDSLRGKQLAREVALTGSRVAKFKHAARETIGVDTNQLIILAELMLRGPQTVGELRSRASRMHPLESLDITQNVLQSLIERPEALVIELPPEPGSRARRYAQLLAPAAHPLEATPIPASTSIGDTNASSPGAAAHNHLAERIDQLEQEVASLRAAITDLAARFGESAHL